MDSEYARLIRRKYLKKVALAGTAGLAGCLGGGGSEPTATSRTTKITTTETATPKPENNINSERPFMYALAPEAIVGRNLNFVRSVEDFYNDNAETYTTLLEARYKDTAAMRENLTDEAWILYAPFAYSFEAQSFKLQAMDPADREAWSPGENGKSYAEALDPSSFEQEVLGKGAHGVINTGMEPDEVTSMVEKQTSEPVNQRKSWTVREGDFIYPKDLSKTSEMRIATKDSMIAYIHGGSVAYPVGEPGDLDKYINTYIDVLTDSPELAFSESNEYGRKAEELFNSQPESREWDYFRERTRQGAETWLDRETDERYPIEQLIILYDHEDQERIEREQATLMNGETVTHTKTQNLVERLGG
jgi:hypothetical protein